MFDLLWWGLIALLYLAGGLAFWTLIRYEDRKVQDGR
jgi:hypothetical protein